MISRLLITSDRETQINQANKIIEGLGLSKNHPDSLWLDSEEEKLGVEAVKKIVDHFKLKPYSASKKAVVIIGSEDLTVDAQNALLKTLEEPPEYACLILTSESENSLLPTILSRCQVENLGIPNSKSQIPNEKLEEIEKIMSSNIEERFEIVEKTEDKEALLKSLIHYFHQKLQKDPKALESAKQVLESEEWAGANVNIRGILEYLMLKLP